ncbi:hypothetical protein Q426_00060 [Streptococcus equi subsp. zooepidemicus CY]|nr:hypothetical protein Q426_00060 [Streptococcus equi subsp. zooepidemicus CY]
MKMADVTISSATQKLNKPIKAADSQHLNKAQG